ncbi:MAG: hypothetical protein ACFFA8_14235 [Promethearchaeota archaeon]
MLEDFDEQYLKILNKIELIPLEDFIHLLQSLPEQFEKIHLSLNLLSFLKKFNNTSMKNLEIISQYHQIVQELILIFKINTLSKTKKILLEELELSRKYQKLSDLAATKDLLKKLDDSIKLNKNKSKYLEQDFIKISNQFDQVKKVIDEYNQQIQNLITKRKNLFSQINKITRDMEIDSSSETGKNSATSYSQRIRNLQIQAKEVQSQINQTKTKLDNSKEKYQKIEPQFLTYESDYQKILETIRNDEKKMKILQQEVIKEMNSSEAKIMNDLSDMKARTVRNPTIIVQEIEELEIELKKIEKLSKLYNPECLFDLSSIKSELKKIEKKINELSKTKISFNENNTKTSLESFRKIEILIQDLEVLLKTFLNEINLSVNLEITIEENSQNFFILLTFIRNNKEQIYFEQLTTPEKIFFVITLYVSIKVLIRSENILFSNLFLPPIYNKRGSLIRTMKKILPQFEVKNNLTQFNLIFILSNIELKDKIKNLKIIKINENE